MIDDRSHADKTKSRMDELVQIALQIGARIIDVVTISTSDISIEDDLANMCRKPVCAFYGLSANCPPYVAIQNTPALQLKRMESTCMI